MQRALQRCARGVGSPRRFFFFCFSVFVSLSLSLSLRTVGRTPRRRFHFTTPPLPLPGRKRLSPDKRASYRVNVSTHARVRTPVGTGYHSAFAPCTAYVINVPARTVRAHTREYLQEWAAAVRGAHV